MGKSIGFVSTRFAGNDGVSLEATKWSEILRGADIDVSGLPVSLTGTRREL
jgi:hypothetical protein